MRHVPWLDLAIRHAHDGNDAAHALLFHHVHHHRTTHCAHRLHWFLHGAHMFVHHPLSFGRVLCSTYLVHLREHFLRLPSRLIEGLTGSHRWCLCRGGRPCRGRTVLRGGRRMVRAIDDVQWDCGGEGGRPAPGRGVNSCCSSTDSSGSTRAVAKAVSTGGCRWKPHTQTL